MSEGNGHSILGVYAQRDNVIYIGPVVLLSERSPYHVESTVSKRSAVIIQLEFFRDVAEFEHVRRKKEWAS